MVANFTGANAIPLAAAPSFGDLLDRGAGKDGRDGHVAIRPAALSLGESDGDLRATVERVVREEATNRVTLSVDDTAVDAFSDRPWAPGDEVWVTVETPGMNVPTPGEYIREDDQHVHGHLEFVVDGERLDFGRDRYQSNDRYFHFEGGDAAAWHAHSYSITLRYALSSLDGVDVSADGRTVRVDGTTYREGEDGTTITIEVGGEPVEPGEYYLKDWDGVRVVVDDGA